MPFVDKLWCTLIKLFQSILQCNGQLGSIVASFEDASKKPFVSKHFAEVIPEGVSKRCQAWESWCHLCWVHVCSSGESCDNRWYKLLYQSCEVQRDGHGEKVRSPDPYTCVTWAHTVDFNCTYMGARLIDGECKGYAPETDSILVLHAAEQLAYKDQGLAMLTTNSSFTFLQLHKRCWNTPHKSELWWTA